jgi:hypothetical protein
MKTIKSFGCSFIYGSELPGESFDEPGSPSILSWPAVIAENLELNYECFASLGAGNFKIYCDILANSYQNDQSLYLINWTWIDRFDYVNQNEQWNTLRPAEDSQLEHFYYKNLHSQLCDMINSASYIVSAAEHLASLNCKFIMTYMDYNLLMPVNPLWQDPRYLEVLQKKLGKLLVNFDDKNFLDWSRDNNFAISKSWHPLEQAHSAAADYWLPAVKRLLL